MAVDKNGRSQFCDWRATHYLYSSLRLSKDSTVAKRNWSPIRHACGFGLSQPVAGSGICCKSLHTTLAKIILPWHKIGTLFVLRIIRRLAQWFSRPLLRALLHRSAIKLDFSISHDSKSVLIICIIQVSLLFSPDEAEPTKQRENQTLQ